MTRLPQLQDDTVGPYFPPPFSTPTNKLDLFRPHCGLNVGPLGEPVLLRIRLLDINGALATSSLLEVWHPNADGHLRVPGNEAALSSDPFFQGYGRVYSLAGDFEIRTAKPGPSKCASGMRAPYVTLTIFSDGISRIVTQMFFEDEAANATDPVLCALPSDLGRRLVARRQDGEPGQKTYALEIRMRGDGETPFFDDDASE